MINIFNLGWLEYKKKFCKRGIYICLGILFFIFFISIRDIIEKNIDISFKPMLAVEGINFICSNFFQFGLILDAINVLLEEFRYGTTTFLFTGNRSRIEILFAKVLSVLLLALTFGLINYFFVICCSWRLSLDHKYFFDYGYIIFIYLIYAWMMGNYFLFFGIILKNRLSSFVVGSFFLYLLSDVAKKIIISFNLSKELLNLNPFLAIDESSFEFFKNPNINIYRVLIMFILGLIFFISSSLVFNKKDLT